MRQFLDYYLLLLLSEKGRTRQQMSQEIRERSDGNRSYRSSGRCGSPVARWTRRWRGLPPRSW